MARGSMPPSPRVKILLDLDFTDMLRDPVEDIRANLRRNVLYAAEIVRGAWVEMARGMNIHRSGDYVDGIRSEGRVEVVSDTGVTTDGVIELVVDITNTSKHAHLVEVGHAPFSLVEAIDWEAGSPSMKRDAFGRPYLHIPFRHFAYATPGERESKGYQQSTTAAMMPESVYDKAKQLAQTVPRRVGPVVDKSGQFLARDRYGIVRSKDHQPSRLAHSASPGARQALSARTGDANNIVDVRRGATLQGVDRNGKILINPGWQNSKFHGMFKSPQGKSGNTYTTIRTITPKSKGWKIPAMMGRRVVARLAADIDTGALGGVLAKALQNGISGGSE